MIYIPISLVIMVPVISLLLCICYAAYLSVKHQKPFLQSFDKQSKEARYNDEIEPMTYFMIITFWPLSILFLLFVFYPYKLIVFTVSNFMKKKDIK